MGFSCSQAKSSRISSSLDAKGAVVEHLVRVRVRVKVRVRVRGRVRVRVRVSASARGDS